MGFLDLTGAANVPDLVLLKDGEYRLRCDGAEIKDSKSTEGNQYLQLVLKAVDEPNAQTIFHNVHLVNGSEDETKRNNKLRIIRDTVKAFDLDLSNTQLPVQDFCGVTVDAIVATEEGDGQYPPKNVIKKFLIPA